MAVVLAIFFIIPYLSLLIIVLLGLFRAAIGESASALSAWAYQNNLPQLTHYLGTLINSDFKTKKPTSAELLKYLKSIPAKTIDAASLQLSNMVMYKNSLFNCFLTV